MIKTILVLYLIPLSYATKCKYTRRTIGGNSCQRWNSDYPHRVLIRPDGNISHNRCAAADPNDPKPFCYTTNPQINREYCDCKVSKSKKNCSKTVSGRSCQFWNSWWPHRPIYQPKKKNNNFCSNPDNDAQGKWCYTTDPNKRWEYCPANCPATTTTSSTTTTRTTTTTTTAPSTSTAQNGVDMCGTSAGLLDTQDIFDHPSVYDKHGTCVTNCGSLPRSQSSRVYGGIDVEKSRVPWIVSLIGPTGCGGTLVSLTTVVTASHCMRSETASDWRIGAGHVNLYSIANAQIRDVVNIIKHPKYNPVTKNNDISLMFVDPPFQFTEYVRPACLPKPSFVINDGYAVVAGFGLTETGRTNDLRWTTIPMHTRMECEENRYVGAYITENMICGGQEGRDTCQGDSGGPLLANVDGKFTLVGITSFGIGCADKNKPGVYAKVANYISWIYDQIAKKSSMATTEPATQQPTTTAPKESTLYTTTPKSTAASTTTSTTTSTSPTTVTTSTTASTTTIAEITTTSSSDQTMCGIVSVQIDLDSILDKPSKYNEDGSCIEHCSSNRSRRNTNRIFGGTEAKTSEIPWIVSLRGPFGCGGTLITMTKIVTAAHCTVSTPAERWQILAGQKSIINWGNYHQLRDVIKVVIHPNYNRNTLDNDIAIMIVNEPFEYTDYVRPACLPSSIFHIQNGFTSIAGYGDTENGIVSELRWTTVPMLSDVQCRNNPSIGMYYTENMICGGTEGRDACQGDSGGPLLASVGGKQTLAGVTSFGIGCAVKNKPGVYTKVANYIVWINATN